MRFRSVSRFCNSLTSESNFMDLHRSRSKIRPGGTKFLVPKREGCYVIEQKEDGKASTWNFDFLYDHLMCANGLFCLWRIFQQPVVICNPSTREVRVLPLLKVEFYSSNSVQPYFYALGYEPEEKNYKVLLTVNDKNGSTKHWVFTLGTDESWREIKVTKRFVPYHEGACISGVYLYMVDLFTKIILAFDVKVEKLRIINLPNALNNMMNYYPLLEVKGKLAVLDSYRDGTNLWILGNAENEEWESHIIHSPLQPPFHLKTRICSSCDGEIVFVVIEPGIFAYYMFDVWKNSWRYLETQGLPNEGWKEFREKSSRYNLFWGLEDDGGIHDDIYSYVESLFSLGKK
ncbi:F-box protein At5g62510-like [Lycium ferocissimum]|uniref:F-box protein At5g62510-like n=1 Tax=Lycium ferocissimum TaxID=112874 RepID=UPI0028164E21|nr:F-box protein At5g62510-like [Lycium ferocissimum]